MKQEFNRFLIIRTDRIGDVLLTLPLAKVIKQRFPKAFVAMLIRHYTSELVEDNQYIDHILYYDNPEAELVPFSRFVEEIRNQKYDIVLHTQPRPRLALVTWLAGIPIRIGTGYRWYSFFFNQKVYEHRKVALRHELEYNLNLLSAINCSYEGIDITPHFQVKPEIIEQVKEMLKTQGFTESEKFVIIHPGSGGSARTWSAKHFSDLAQRLGNNSGVRVVITGKKDEEKVVNEIISKADTNVTKMLDFGNLREFAALAKLAGLFISNSTGPIHLAAAVGTPVIGLYPQLTAQNATRWGPYTHLKTVFSPKDRPVDCKKCQIPHTMNCECMESISVDEVFRAAMQYIVGFK